MISPRSIFVQKIIEVIQAIPPGRVVSYGQIAAYIGVPRSARQVGWTLRNLEQTVSLPWWRVVNNAGRISIEGNIHNDKVLQRKLLEQEGVKINEDYSFLIEQYRFRANETLLRKWGLPDSYRETVLIKYGL